MHISRAYKRTSKPTYIVYHKWKYTSRKSMVVMIPVERVGADFPMAVPREGTVERMMSLTDVGTMAALLMLMSKALSAPTPIKAIEVSLHEHVRDRHRDILTRIGENIAHSDHTRDRASLLHLTPPTQNSCVTTPSGSPSPTHRLQLLTKLTTKYGDDVLFAPFDGAQHPQRPPDRTTRTRKRQNPPERRPL